MLTNRLSMPQLGAQAGAALMVESVQLCVVWGLLARAADEKQTSVLGGYVADVWCLLCVFRCSVPAGSVALLCVKHVLPDPCASPNPSPCFTHICTFCCCNTQHNNDNNNDIYNNDDTACCILIGRGKLCGWAVQVLQSRLHSTPV